jgi:hypothetical protein
MPAERLSDRLWREQMQRWSPMAPGGSPDRVAAVVAGS